MIVVKRDGSKVPFMATKIIDAIGKAYNEVNEEWFPVAGQLVADKILFYFKDKDEVSVEEIQDIVEKELMKINPTVARAYIRYRYKREVARGFSDDFLNSIREKIEGRNVQNSNANVDENSFGGRMGEATNELLKKYALDNCMSSMARNNHLNNEIYIHDLNSYAVGMHNCLSIPFDDLLANGFNTRQTDVRPANSVNTAFQLVAVIFQLQSLQQFGGVSATHIDWTMVPYVRKSFYKHFLDGVFYCQDNKMLNIMGVYETFDLTDAKSDWIKSNASIENELFSRNERAYKYAMEMTIKEIHQAVEAMYHNLNTLQSRSGNQLPFTSINYGTCTLPEGRMVTKALLEVSIEGLGALHKTSIFPCGIFQCMKGVNRAPGDPNYDLFQLALKSTAQRLYPNYANVDWSGNAGYDKNDPRTYFSTINYTVAIHSNMYRKLI